MTRLTAHIILTVVEVEKVLRYQTLENVSDDSFHGHQTFLHDNHLHIQRVG